ncbi:MAG: tetratricopeptide repeat protein [Thermoguttaceae bacterium]|nr:tetratricopeptide repeat protein [Thermoguttaceae bacterium]
MKSSFSAKSQIPSRSFGRRLLVIGAGLAAVCFLSSSPAPLEAKESGRISIPSPISRSAQDESDTGNAVTQKNEQAREGTSSLLDGIQFLFKKDAKESEKSADSEADPKIIKRRPLAERLESETPNGAPGAGNETLRSLSADELRQKGDAEFEANRYDEAEKYYRELIGRNGSADGVDTALVSAYHHMGIINRDRKDYAEAQRYLVLAVKSDPNKSAMITFDYAKLLYDIEKYDRAEKLFTYLEEKKPEVTQARYYKGLCLLNTDPANGEILAYLEGEIGREKACEMIAEKCEAAGATERAEEMKGILESIHAAADSRVPAEEAVGQLASTEEIQEEEPAETSLFDDSNTVYLGSSALASASSESVSLTSLTEETAPSDGADQMRIDGLSQDQTTRMSSPMINIETLGPKQTMVGRESEYKISVENRGSQSAANLIVRTDIPDDVDITNVNTSTGSSHISADEDGQLVCLWNLGNFNPEQKEMLTFKFTPRVRNNINFVTVCDYDKTILSSGISVTQPILDLAIEGSDTIQWGSEERYRVKISNSGDGAAQNIRLTVSTGDNDNATRILSSLEPGEEKQLEVNMKTVLDGVLDITAKAEADYGFTASAEKEVDILRGQLDLFVEVPEVQFVNENADYVIHVCNTGRAVLRDVEVVAAVPTSIEIVSTTGNPTQNRSTDQLVWTIGAIKPEEEIVYQVNAKMLRPGGSRIDVTAADRTGVSSFGNAEIQVEAIAALEMKIGKPTGAIATGKEVVYDVVISNSGTKAAEKIDAGFFLPTEMNPVAVEGGGKVIPEEKKVLFNKINFLGPGQSVTYRVHAVAQERGNHKVQAVLESKSDNVQLVSEEMNFFYDKKPMLAQHSGAEREKNLASAEKSDASEMPVRLASRTTEEDQPEAEPEPMILTDPLDGDPIPSL